MAGLDVYLHGTLNFGSWFQQVVFDFHGPLALRNYKLKILYVGDISLSPWDPRFLDMSCCTSSLDDLAIVDGRLLVQHRVYMHIGSMELRTCWEAYSEFDFIINWHMAVLCMRTNEELLGAFIPRGAFFSSMDDGKLVHVWDSQWRWRWPPPRMAHMDDDEGDGRCDEWEALEQHDGDESPSEIDDESGGNENSEGSDGHEDEPTTGPEPQIQNTDLATGPANAVRETPAEEEGEQQQQEVTRGDDRRSNHPRVANDSMISVTVDDYGEIWWMPDLREFHAICRCNSHDPHKGKPCMRVRTVDPGPKRGQGRPLGFLTAWLQAQHEYHTRWEHVHLCNPVLSSRKDGRRTLASFEGAEVLFSKERARDLANEEPEEPDVFY